MLSLVAGAALAGSPYLITPPRISAGDPAPLVEVVGPVDVPVHLIGGAAVGPGPCIGPVCLGLVPPLVRLGREPAGPLSVTPFTLPPLADDTARTHLPLQAVAADGRTTPPLAARIGPRTLMIAQDVTGSFRHTSDHARDANLHLLERFMDDPWPLDQVGMTAFVGGVEEAPWAPLQRIAGNEDEIHSRWRTLESCNCALGDVLTEETCVASYGPYYSFEPFDTCWEWFCDTWYGNIDGQPWMPDCLDVGAQTSHGPGIQQAVDAILDAESTVGPDPAVLLMTDGLPCCGVDVIIERQAQAVAAADAAADAGIDLYVIALNEAEVDVAFLEGLVRGDGQAWEVRDPAHLTLATDALADILSE